VRQDSVERPRHTLEVERLDEEHGVPLLAIPHEAVQLFLERPGAMRRLLLVRAERAQLALHLEHALHSVRPDRTRQLVLEIARAGVEADALEPVTVVALQRAQKLPLLADVVEPAVADVARACGSATFAAEIAAERPAVTDRCRVQPSGLQPPRRMQTVYLPVRED